VFALLLMAVGGAGFQDDTGDFTVFVLLLLLLLLLNNDAFVDVGTVWNSSGIENFDRQMLMSVGTGLRWELGDTMSANFYWGIPLVDVNSRGRTWQEKGLHFSVQSRFYF